MSEKKYLERKAQAAHIIKEQYVLISSVFDEATNYLNSFKMLDSMKKIHTVNIDSELSKADRSIYIMNQYKKMLEAERRRQKYDALLKNVEEEIATKLLVASTIKQERKRQAEPSGIILVLYNVM